MSRLYLLGLYIKIGEGKITKEESFTLLIFCVDNSKKIIKQCNKCKQAVCLVFIRLT